MRQGIIYLVDCERSDWVVLRLVRLGKNPGKRYNLSVQMSDDGPLVQVKEQEEGDSFVAGVCIEDWT